MGAAYGTAKSGVGIAAMAIMKPELIMKSVVPVVMAGILAIYGVVVAVLIANTINKEGTTMAKVSFSRVETPVVFVSRFAQNAASKF
jgi:V-type H+-transporting ATPase proteolipid subunit